MYLMENESIVCEHGPPRVPAAFNYTPTHRRRMLDADAAVPAKMVSVLLRSTSINQPSASTDESAARTLLSAMSSSFSSSAASSVVTSSLSATSVSSGHALQLLMQAPGHASISNSNPVPRFGVFLHSSPPVTASYAAPAPSSSSAYVALQATQDYLKRKRIDEFVEQESNRSTARLKASAEASARAKRLALSSSSSDVTSSSAADLSADTGPIVSPLPLVCGLCRVRPQEVGTSSCRIGYLSANAGDCCRRCNVTAEVYELLHTYRSFDARENNWFTSALAKIRSSAGRYSGLIADLGTNHFIDEDNGLDEDNSGGDSEGTIDPVTGAHDLAGGRGIPMEREVVVEPLVVAQLVLPLISKLKAKTRSSIVHPPQAFSAVSTSFQQAPSSQPMVRRSLSGAHTNVISGASKKKSTSVVSKLRK